MYRQNHSLVGHTNYLDDFDILSYYSESFRVGFVYNAGLSVSDVLNKSIKPLIHFHVTAVYRIYLFEFKRNIDYSFDKAFKKESNIEHIYWLYQKANHQKRTNAINP